MDESSASSSTSKPPQPTMLNPSHYSMTASHTPHPTSPMQSPKSMAAIPLPPPPPQSSSTSADAPRIHQYPSPTAAQVGQGTAGPFFGSSAHHAPTSSSSSSGPSDAFQLSAIAQHNSQLPILSGTGAASVSMVSPTANMLRHSSSPVDPNIPSGSIDMTNDPDSFVGLPGTAPRKRSKASRACDECRRKKIRCDATSENVNEPCSSCKRLSVQCNFSRPPMKRGPSKGYIQNLADRVVELENSSRHPAGLATNLVSYDAAASPGGDTDFSPASSTPGSISKQARKRTFSVSNDSPSYSYFAPPPTAQRVSVGSSIWSPQDATAPSRHLPHPGSAQKLHTPHSSVSERSHRSSNPQHSSFSSTEIPPPSVWSHRHSSTLPPEVNWSRIGSTQETSPEWDDEMMKSYTSIIRPIFPLLPYSKARLESILSGLHNTLRQAFLHALYAAVRSCLPPSASSSEMHPSSRAGYLINSFQFEASGVQSTLSSLIHLQTLLFLCMEAGSHGPSNAKDRVGPPPAVWLGNAFGVASHIKLHAYRANASKDFDDEENLGRRIFLCLVNLDRWHAASTASPLLSSETDVAVYPEDRPVIGDAVYQFTRLSSDLGTLTSLLQSSQPPSSLSTTFTTSLLLRLRESLSELSPPSPFLFLCHAHLLLLATRYKPGVEPADLLDITLRMLSQLKDESLPLSPLHYHFIALVGWTLAEIAQEDSDGPGTAGEEARLKGRELREALDKRIGGTNGSEGTASSASQGVSWDRAVRDILPFGDGKDARNSSTSAPPGSAGSISGGLEHLAALAVRQNSAASAAAAAAAAAGGGNGKEAAKKWDPTRITRLGYLNTFPNE